MKADLTRVSFDPLKRFTSVLMQQGRVQLDADWNEQASILLHFLRRLAADVYGPNGGPGTGFRVGPVPTTTVVTDDFVIDAGTYYVNGILCELGATQVPILAWTVPPQITVAAWTIDGAPFQVGQYLNIVDDSDIPPPILTTARISELDYSKMSLSLDSSANLSKLDKEKRPRLYRLATYHSQPYLPAPLPLTTGQVYLDVWERLVTCLEDDTIREVALNGPDTAARTHIVWQVKVTTAKDLQVCMTQQAIYDKLQPWNRGLLRARTTPAQSSADPCIITPDSQYRGPENQLYRVEIHTGTAPSSATGAAPTFKWSRENGSVVFPIVTVASEGGMTTVTLTTLGHDDRFGLKEGDFVEIQDDNSVLLNVVGQLLQVQSIDRTRRSVVLAGVADAKADLALHPLLRRWDHRRKVAEGGLELGSDNAALIPVTGPGSEWLDLEDGVQVQFVILEGFQFRTGDYWLIPARVATGDVVWPTETGLDAQGKPVTKQLAKPPDGVTHHYAPLATVTVHDTAGDTAVPGFTKCDRAVAPA